MMMSTFVWPSVRDLSISPTTTTTTTISARETDTSQRWRSMLLYNKWRSEYCWFLLWGFMAKIDRPFVVRMRVNDCLSDSSESNGRWLPPQNHLMTSSKNLFANVIGSWRPTLSSIWIIDSFFVSDHLIYNFATPSLYNMFYWCFGHVGSDKNVITK